MLNDISTTGLFLANANPLLHVVDHVIYQNGSFVLTNHMVLMAAAAVLMLLVFIPLARRYARSGFVPSGLNNLFETILMFVREEIARPVLGDKTDKFMSYLWTVFFFILFNNIIGLLPLDPITGLVTAPLGLHPIAGTATANIVITGSLALVAFLVIQLSAIKVNGVGGWLHHLLGGAPIFMAPVMVPVELMGMLIKPVALAIRLMANMVAGHTLMAVLIGFVGSAAAAGAVLLVGIGIPVVIGSTAIMLLETFVAFLQAYIFTFLTTIFIGLMVVHDDHHGHDESFTPHKEEHVPLSDPAGSGPLVSND